MIQGREKVSPQGMELSLGKRSIIPNANETQHETYSIKMKMASYSPVKTA